MERTSQLEWHPSLRDPTGRRNGKPRTIGKTMVIDKGMGLYTLDDLLQTAASYIDIIKIGFGTTPLYPTDILRKKIDLAKRYGISIMPGGTFLEIAVSQNVVDEYFDMIGQLGFNAIEVSDGTIEIGRELRNELIGRGLERRLTVFTEYGKKKWGFQTDIDMLTETVLQDIRCGASLVAIEARESGTGVGIFDENGVCRDAEVQQIVRQIPDPGWIMWEAPQKSQQVHLLNMLGPDINLGNVAPQDILSLETLRRGLRSDTFGFGLR